MVKGPVHDISELAAGCDSHWCCWPETCKAEGKIILVAELQILNKAQLVLVLFYVVLC